MDPDVVAAEIDTELRARGTPERAAHEQAYLKSRLEHYGVSVPAIHAVARRRRPDLTHDELVALVLALWNEPVHERRMAAVELLDLSSALLVPSDMALLERLLRESRTWALVDGLAASVTGALVEREPSAAAVLDRWAADEDFWLRRAALLALLVPLRRGEGDFDRFARYADTMLDDTELFVRKAIGWVLRDTGRKRPTLVFEWLLPRAARLSAVTRREAVKPLSDDQRQAILARESIGPRHSSRAAALAGGVGFGNESDTMTGSAARRAPRRGTGAAAALVAASAFAGAIGLATGGLELSNTVTERLPFASPVFGGVALALVVAVPFSVLAYRAFRSDPRTASTAFAAGLALVGWIVVQVVVIRELSVFQLVYLLVGAAFAFAGRRGLGGR